MSGKAGDEKKAGKNVSAARERGRGRGDRIQTYIVLKVVLIIVIVVLHVLKVIVVIIKVLKLERLAREEVDRARDDLRGASAHGAVLDVLADLVVELEALLELLLVRVVLGRREEAVRGVRCVCFLLRVLLPLDLAPERGTGTSSRARRCRRTRSGSGGRTPATRCCGEARAVIVSLSPMWFRSAVSQNSGMSFGPATVFGSGS